MLAPGSGRVERSCIKASAPEDLVGNQDDACPDLRLSARLKEQGFTEQRHLSWDLKDGKDFDRQNIENCLPYRWKEQQKMSPSWGVEGMPLSGTAACCLPPDWSGLAPG